VRQHEECKYVANVDRTIKSYRLQLGLIRGLPCAKPAVARCADCGMAFALTARWNVAGSHSVASAMTTMRPLVCQEVCSNGPQSDSESSGNAWQVQLEFAS
jgi:hypothetical protein